MIKIELLVGCCIKRVTKRQEKDRYSCSFPACPAIRRSRAANHQTGTTQRFVRDEFIQYRFQSSYRWVAESREPSEDKRRTDFRDRSPPRTARRRGIRPIRVKLAYRRDAESMELSEDKRIRISVSIPSLPRNLSHSPLTPDEVVPSMRKKSNPQRFERPILISTYLQAVY